VSDDSRRRPTLLLIDVEPDVRKPPPDARNGWEGTRAALPLIEELRGRLEQRTAAPVVLNWFLRCDPQIEETWGGLDEVRRLVPGLIDAIVAHDDYAGIHPHLWRWDPDERDWYNDLRDDAWMQRCLDSAVAGYSAVLGRTPEACRFGDRWSSDAGVRALRARGIRYDLTPEPGRPEEPPPGDGRAVGTLPDTRRMPRVPFRSTVDDAAPDADGVPWILPLTTSPPRWQPVWYAPFVVRASVSPNLGLSPLLVLPHLERELARDTTDPLVLVLRSGDLCRPRRLRHFRRNVARLLAHPGLRRCELVTPPVAIRRWVDGAAR
jgi:hypothetical protein